jgi:hypothetical protein
MVGAGLTGQFRVRMLRPAFDEVRKLCRRTRDGMEIRRHLLKLRHWPNTHHVTENGTLLDLDWSYIRALSGLKIGELRIHDTISGNDNLRGIFFVGDSAIVDPLPMIWILCVFQKKRDDFTHHQLEIFKARRGIVIERF